MLTDDPSAKGLLFTNLLWGLLRRLNFYACPGHMERGLTGRPSLFGRHLYLQGVFVFGVQAAHMLFQVNQLVLFFIYTPPILLDAHQEMFVERNTVCHELKNVGPAVTHIHPQALFWPLSNR